MQVEQGFTIEQIEAAKTKAMDHLLAIKANGGMRVHHRDSVMQMEIDALAADMQRAQAEGRPMATREGLLSYAAGRVEEESRRSEEYLSEARGLSKRAEDHRGIDTYAARNAVSEAESDAAYVRQNAADARSRMAAVLAFTEALGIGGAEVTAFKINGKHNGHHHYQGNGR